MKVPLRSASLLLACLPLLLANSRAAQQFHFVSFNWLPGDDETLKKKISAFYGISADSHPFVTRSGNVTKINNPGGAPIAMAAASLRPEPGLWTLRFEARSPDLTEDKKVRASVTFLTGRHDFEVRKEWSHVGATVFVPGDIGIGNITASLRARTGELELRNVSLNPVEFTAAQSLDEVSSRFQLHFEGELESGLVLQWQVVPLSKWSESLPWQEQTIDVLSQNPLIGISFSPPADRFIVRWKLRDSAGNIVHSGNEMRGGQTPDAPQGPVRRNVEISDSGVLAIDGKPFFPIGIYTQKTAHKNVVDEVKELGLNLALMFPSADQKEAVSHAAKLGMEVILQGSVPSSAKDMDAAVYEAQKDIVELPVLTTVAVDEPDLQSAYHPVLENLYRALRRFDSRPVFTSNHSVSSFSALSTQTDILAIDPYPVATLTQPLYMVAAWMDAARRFVGNKKSIWYINQTFSIAPVWTHHANPDEVNAMNWIALNHGARGIIYYSLYDILAPKFENHEWSLSKSVLASTVKRSSCEISALSEHLLSPAGPSRIYGSNGSIDAAMWSAGAFLALVNLSDRPQETTLSVPCKNCSYFDAVKNKSVSANQRTLIIPLEGYEVRLLLNESVPHNEKRETITKLHGCKFR